MNKKYRVISQPATAHVAMVDVENWNAAMGKVLWIGIELSLSEKCLQRARTGHRLCEPCAGWFILLIPELVEQSGEDVF